MFLLLVKPQSLHLTQQFLLLRELHLDQMELDTEWIPVLGLIETDSQLLSRPEDRKKPFTNNADKIHQIELVTQCYEDLHMAKVYF